MQLQRILLLFLLVAGLGVLAWQSGGGAGGLEVTETRVVLPQLESSRVSKIFVDQVRAGDRFALERDARGTWQMTEPVAWRADSGIVRAVLDHLRKLPAEVVEGIDETEAELDPGVVRLEVTERIGDRDRVWLVRIGRLDLGERDVFVAVGEAGESEEILRVPRSLFDTPNYGYDHFRSRKLFEFDPSQVIAIRRSGSLTAPSQRMGPAPEQGAGVPGDLSEDLGMLVEADGAQWHTTEPYRARLEPGLVYPFLLVLSQLRAVDFMGDDGRRPERFGFDPPWLEIEVDLGGGDVIGVEFGSEPGFANRDVDDRVWYARRKGLPNVFTIRPGTVYSFTQPLVELIDANLFQVRREDIAGFEVERAGRGLRFEVVGPERYTVREFGADPSAAMAADPGQTEDLLAKLESASAAAFLPPEETFETVGTLRLLLKDGSQPVVEFAERTELFGIEGTPVRRQGEQVFGFDIEGLGELADEQPETFLSRVPFDIAEHRCTAIELAGLGRERRWVRDGSTGQWQPDGVAAEDRDFGVWIDRLRKPRMRSWHLDRSPEEVFAEAADAGGGGAARRLRWTVEDLEGVRSVVEAVPGRNADGAEITYLVHDGRVGETTAEVFDGLEELLLVQGR